MIKQSDIGQWSYAIYWTFVLLSCCYRMLFSYHHVQLGDSMKIECVSPEHLLIC